jgi:alpha-galactosidase
MLAGRALSFRCDAQAGPQGWTREVGRAVRGDGIDQTRMAWRSPPASGLSATVEWLRFPDPPACEWLLSLAQAGDACGPLLTEVYPLDITLPLADGARLHYARGGMAGPDDYAPVGEPLPTATAARFELAASGGRSSNRHLPFFNVQTGADRGFMVAVGWSGQWHAIVETDGQGHLRVRAGMQDVALALAPGEAIRTPRIVVIPWHGDPVDGHNALRRFLRRWHTPRLRGAPPPPMTWANTWFTFNCGYAVNDANQKESMDGAARLGLEYLTVDAGWYECAHPFWWDGVGSWVPRRDAFPGGFAPLAAYGRERGVGFGLWFEPERAAASSRLAREHPEWLLGPSDVLAAAAASVGVEHSSLLVNLGLPEVQDWLIGLVDEYVRQGMRWFRHDFNLDPLPVWRAADPPHRQGISEIRYIEGLYRILDEIHRRHPDLYIEGCASGGRRIDLETLSRNHGYWATDMMCGTPEPMQAHIWGFNRYLLPNWHNTVLQMPNAPLADTPANRYAFFSFLGGAPCLCFDLRSPQLDHDLGRRWLALFRSLRHLTFGDFYPLTDHSLRRDAWLAFQFDSPERGEGLVVAFRRPACPEARALFALRGLCASARYCVRDCLAGGETRHPGAALLAGLAVERPAAPDVAILHYTRDDPHATGTGAAAAPGEPARE